MSRVIDEILISGQDLEKYHKLNPIDIKIDNSQRISTLSKYGKYRLKITTLLISASFNQTTNVIFITFNGLNNAKKAVINGKIHNVLGVINLIEETNFDLIKSNSKWLNIRVKESNTEAKHFTFHVTSNSLLIRNFSYSMLDSKENLLTFPADEKKVPVLNFAIQVIIIVIISTLFEIGKTYIALQKIYSLIYTN